MESTLFLKNKLYRHIEWNGQMLTFYRNARNEYGEVIDDDVVIDFTFKCLFHDGGGYGGMLNIELYERDGARTITKFKPMILCKYSDGFPLQMDDMVDINDNTYRVVEKNDVKNLGIAFEISLEAINGDTSS